MSGKSHRSTSVGCNLRPDPSGGAAGGGWVEFWSAAGKDPGSFVRSFVGQIGFDSSAGKKTQSKQLSAGVKTPTTH